MSTIKCKCPFCSKIITESSLFYDIHGRLKYECLRSESREFPFGVSKRIGETQKGSRGFEVVKPEFMRVYSNPNEVKLPWCNDEESAGYDFYLPYNVTIGPKNSTMIFTDVKVYMEDGEMFQMFPRSSSGIKKNLMLMNTVGIIDKNYYNNESNDGNIIIALYNFGNESVELKEDERIIQGVFVPFLKDNPLSSFRRRGNDLRRGGVGSSD